MREPLVPVNKDDSASAKPLPVPRRKSVKDGPVKSCTGVDSKETNMNDNSFLERIPPQLPPRPDNNHVEPETVSPGEFHKVTPKAPPELPKRPCSKGQNGDVTSSKPPTVPARTDLQSGDDFPVPPPRKGRKKIID